MIHGAADFAPICTIYPPAPLSGAGEQNNQGETTSKVVYSAMVIRCKS